MNDSSALPLDTVPDLPAPGDPAPPQAPKRGPGRPKGSGKRRESSPKPPPSTSADAGAGRGPGRPRAIDKLGDNLAAQLAAVASIVYVFNPIAGTVLLEDAEAHGKALAKLAEQNPRVRRLLEGSLTGSAWVGVAVAFGTTAFKIQLALKAEAAAGSAAGPAFPDLSSLFTFGTSPDGGQ